MKLEGKLPFFWCVTLFMPIPGQAHPFSLAGDSIGFFSGLVDPFASADHILALLAFGLWVYRTGKPLVYMGIRVKIPPISINPTKTMGRR